MPGWRLMWAGLRRGPAMGKFTFFTLAPPLLPVRDEVEKHP